MAVEVVDVYEVEVLVKVVVVAAEVMVLEVVVIV